MSFNTQTVTKQTEFRFPLPPAVSLEQSNSNGNGGGSPGPAAKTMMTAKTTTTTRVTRSAWDFPCVAPEESLRSPPPLRVPPPSPAPGGQMVKASTMVKATTIPMHAQTRSRSCSSSGFGSMPVMGGEWGQRMAVVNAAAAGNHGPITTPPIPKGMSASYIVLPPPAYAAVQLPKQSNMPRSSTASSGSLGYGHLPLDAAASRRGEGHSREGSSSSSSGKSTKRVTFATPDSPPSRTTSPKLTTDAKRVHPLLDENTTLFYDFAYAFEQNKIYTKSGDVVSLETLNEPALAGAKMITLAFEETEWEMDVYGSFSRPPTVADVMMTIFNHLMEEVSPQSWDGVDLQSRCLAEQARIKRRGSHRRRMDLLCGKTLFGGLSRYPGDKWIVNFSPGMPRVATRRLSHC